MSNQRYPVNYFSSPPFRSFARQSFSSANHSLLASSLPSTLRRHRTGTFEEQTKAIFVGNYEAFETKRCRRPQTVATLKLDDEHQQKQVFTKIPGGLIYFLILQHLKSFFDSSFFK